VAAWEKESNYDGRGALHPPERRLVLFSRHWGPYHSRRRRLCAYVPRVGALARGVGTRTLLALAAVEKGIPMGLVLLIVILILLFGGLPQISGQWHSYGYAPSGILFVVLIIVVIFFLLGRF